MPILIMGLIALGMFGVIGIMLFLAESSERRHEERFHHTSLPAKNQGADVDEIMLRSVCFNEKG
jgi:hypothetical protein